MYRNTMLWPQLQEIERETSRQMEHKLLPNLNTRPPWLLWTWRWSTPLSTSRGWGHWERPPMSAKVRVAMTFLRNFARSRSKRTMKRSRKIESWLKILGLRRNHNHGTADGPRAWSDQPSVFHHDDLASMVISVFLYIYARTVCDATWACEQ